MEAGAPKRRMLPKPLAAVMRLTTADDAPLRRGRKMQPRCHSQSWRPAHCLRALPWGESLARCR